VYYLVDSNKLELLQRGFAALCFSSLLPQVHYCYFLASEEFKLRILRMSTHSLNALFHIRVYLGFKFCPFLETVGLPFPARYIRDFALFNFRPSYKHCPSARCASSRNVVLRKTDVFSIKNIVLNHMLCPCGLRNGNYGTARSPVELSQRRKLADKRILLGVPSGPCTATSKVYTYVT
jgi:hypothetical protein